MRKAGRDNEVRIEEVKCGDEEAGQEILESPETHCEVCRSGDREHLLLLCDGCDLGYHTDCLDPPLQVRKVAV